MKTITIILIIFMLASCTCKPREFIRVAAIKPGTCGNVGSLRYRCLQESATTVGAQAGLAWRAEQINCVLKHQQDYLDRVFNFRELLLKDDVLPPVLAEGKQELNLDSCIEIRAADRIYKIISPPCFVTAPPNWREYVCMHFKKPEQPDFSVLPKNSEEASVWNCYINIGWQQGIDQANQIFSANLARLKRDYNGMVLYRKLLSQNMVTAPYVSKAELGVTGNSNEMRINDRVLRIASTSELNTDSSTWKPALRHETTKTTCVTQGVPYKSTTITKATQFQPGNYYFEAPNE